MPHVHWTGNPFVDAGLAALAAAARVSTLEELGAKHLEQAVLELERVLLSDQALGIGVDKAFSGPKKALQQVFPNSELDNPSNWKGRTPAEKVDNARCKFRDALRSELDKAKQCLEVEEVGETCFACGERRPKIAMETRRKDKMPLFEGIVNFYPGFSHGVRVCGLCSLAVRFLPLSIMRAGNQNRLWFLHSQHLGIAATVARKYGWEHFNRLITGNKALDFYGSWETAGEAGTVVYLFCELLNSFPDQLRAIYRTGLPSTAYVFSNDNRGGFIQALHVPNELLSFLARLQIESKNAFKDFWEELLKVRGDLREDERKTRAGFVRSVSNRMIAGENIVGLCLTSDPPKLQGGWLGHRLYLQEVRGMAPEKLAILERLGISIATSEDAKKRVTELVTAQYHQLYGLLLGYVRKGWLSHQEFYFLLPPNAHKVAGEIRDVLLAVAYEWQHCQQEGKEFPRTTPGKAEASPDETLRRIQDIGHRLTNNLPNLQRWTKELASARYAERVRGVYLNAVRHGAVGFGDYVFLAPLQDQRAMWLLRDYLLAFLFDVGRVELPEDEYLEFGAEQVREIETL